METITLLGLVIGTVGIAYLTHGFLGKVVRGERHSASLIAGACILAALAIILSDNAAPLLALAFGALYGVIVEGFWRRAIFDTSSIRGFIKNLVLFYSFGVPLFALIDIVLRAGHKMTDVASEIKPEFTSVTVFLASWSLLVAVAYIMKRLMLRMSEPLLRFVGAALVLAGAACIMAPSVLPLFRTA